MVIRLGRKKIIALLFAFTALAITLGVFSLVRAKEPQEEKSYIKWAELNVSLAALKDTMELDIKTFDSLYHIEWTSSLAYLACKNGNDWSAYRKKDLENMLLALNESYTIEDIIGDNKYYTYYKEVFSAALGGLLGEFERQIPGENGELATRSGYGLVAYSPIAEGFSYSHYDDFGVSRSYGYRRSHLGNDLLGSIGTPIIAVEGGTVECIGWNQYGGWRLGIRSFDGKRSYYYAHLRKDHPYCDKISQGTLVKAGQVIGYMGMTGYSQTENVNGMNVPHLHFGLQLIFDESQKEGENQIWLNVYNLVRLLSQNRATVIRDEESGEYRRKFDIIDRRWPQELQSF